MQAECEPRSVSNSTLPLQGLSTPKIVGTALYLISFVSFCSTSARLIVSIRWLLHAALITLSDTTFWTDAVFSLLLPTRRFDCEVNRELYCSATFDAYPSLSYKIVHHMCPTSSWSALRTPPSNSCSCSSSLRIPICLLWLEKPCPTVPSLIFAILNWQCHGAHHNCTWRIANSDPL